MFKSRANFTCFSKQKYRNILNQANTVYYVSKETYKPYLMIQRDEYMVDKSSLLIAVFDGSKGGQTTFDYALKKGISIVRINPYLLKLPKSIIKMKIYSYQKISFN